MLHPHHLTWPWHYTLLQQSTGCMSPSGLQARSDWFLWDFIWTSLHTMGPSSRELWTATGSCQLSSTLDMGFMSPIATSLPCHVNFLQPTSTVTSSSITIAGLGNCNPSQIHLGCPSSSDGFTIQYILCLPPTDQHLWLTSSKTLGPMAHVSPIRNLSRCRIPLVFGSNLILSISQL